MTDDELWTAFARQGVSAEQWTHRAHLRVAYLHAARWPLEEAHLRMRTGIIRLNAAHGLVETVARGYHETLTYVWLAVIVAAAARDGYAAGVRDSEAFLNAHPELLAREFPLAFYSRERLFSLRARAVFVAPDVSPLPA